MGQIKKRKALKSLLRKELLKNGISWNDFEKSGFYHRRSTVITWETGKTDVIQDTEKEHYAKVLHYLKSVSDKEIEILYKECFNYSKTLDKKLWLTITKKIDSLFSIAGKALFVSQPYPLGKGSKLYRIHNLNNFSLENILTGYEKIVPIDFCKKQRLNEDREQLIYLAFDRNVALSELGLDSEKDKYVIIVYDVKDNFDLLPITTDIGAVQGLSEFEKFYLKKRNEIITKLFSLPTALGGEYDISNYIVKKGYKLDGGNKGWLYPSIKYTGGNQAINYRTSCVAFSREYYEEILDLENVNLEFSKACVGETYKFRDLTLHIKLSGE